MSQADRNHDELSLKDIFLKIRNIYLMLMPHFVLITILSIVGGTIGYSYAYFISPKYEATLTFMVDAGKSNSMGGVSQLASSFGFGSLSTSNPLDSKKMEDLLLSNKINCIALFEKETINGKTDFLANHFLWLSSLQALQVFSVKCKKRYEALKKFLMANMTVFLSRPSSTPGA